MENRAHIAVMAGTPVDTQMGMDVLSRRKLPGLALPVSATPQEQMLFQISSPEEKHERVLSLLEGAKEQGCKKAFIYCNSLSGSLSFPELEQETGMHIVTPMDVYARLADRYRSLAVIAANAAGGAAGIEKAMLAKNGELRLICVGLLSLVEAIEAGVDPAELMARFGLPALCRWFQDNGAEALLLGCTHFPYFKDALAPLTSLPLIDPAEEMLDLLG